MKKLKRTNGITLIALVITIIVLLILAGITINLTIGQDGIITKAMEAGITQEKAQLKEELELEILDIQANKISNGEEFKREDLQELSNIGATMEGYGIPAEGEYKDYYFEVDENYNVTIIGKLQGEKPTIQAQILTEGIVEQGGTVEIKVTANITEGNIVTLEATNGAVLKTDTSISEKIYEVSANGTYYFKVAAENGRSAVVAVEVNTIIEAPKISIKDITKTGFTIQVTNNYAEGLISQYKYYVGGTLKSPANTTTKEYTVTDLKAETEYTNIYVEAYIGENKLTSEVTTATTKPLGIEYSWEELEALAKAISDNDDTITSDTEQVNMTVNGTNYTVAVGDIATVEGKKVRVLGFNHDKLSDTSAYGGESTYAGISFEYVDFITSHSQMNSSKTNSGGWGACALRTTLNGSLYNSIKDIVNIKQVEKAYCAKYSSAILSYTDDYLWLLSCAEIWDNGFTARSFGYSWGKEGSQYKYYKNIDATYNRSFDDLKKPFSVAGTSSIGTDWWLRSSSYNYSTGFCCVETGGVCTNSNASYSLGVAPGFAI